jgi:glycosyltransferase involved in cell wall biosynthesis
VNSLLSQTHRDWEAVLMDSGVLMGQGYFDFVKDSRVKVVRSGEEPGQGKTTNMASWCFNRWLNSGQATGELIMYLCDDDILYPEAFETFWKFYVKNKREPQAMYASQDVGLVDSNGKTKIINRRVADRLAGRFAGGRRLDCRVDYLQFCHTRKILDKFREAYKTSQYHSEDKRDAYHSDGIFMEQIGEITTIYNIEKVLSMNRRTTDSVNLEYSNSAFGRIMMTIRQKFRGARDRIFSPRRH